jgi:hypothetical protein
MISSLMPVGVPQLPGARPATSNICDSMPLASLIGDMLNQSQLLLIMSCICDTQARECPEGSMVYRQRQHYTMDGRRHKSALRMCPRRRTYRSRIIITKPLSRAGATTCGRCRLAARYGCTTKKGPPTSTWRDGESTLGTWVQGLGPNQGGTRICSVASSVADRRVRYRQHAVGCADGWAREERPKRVSV